MKLPRVSSNFAIVDVKNGRAALQRLTDVRLHKIPCTITGEITVSNSGDDGTSIEFQIDVQGFELFQPRAKGENKWESRQKSNKLLRQKNAIPKGARGRASIKSKPAIG